MTSWAIVGAARGIGFEFVKQLSSRRNTTVLALIRSQNTAGPLNELAAERKNIHVIEVDISSPASLRRTAESVGTITGGKLDVLICNAYLAGTEAIMWSPSAFAGKEQALESEIFEPLKVNLLQQVNTINTFLPLIRNGGQKKIIYISSGHADNACIRICEIPIMLGYAVSKSAGNVVMAKYAAELKSEGIKTLALSPGWVDTDPNKAAKENNPEMVDGMVKSFQKMDPKVTGPISTEESIRDQLQVIDRLDETMSGKFVSHHGNEDWF